MQVKFEVGHYLMIFDSLELVLLNLEQPQYPVARKLVKFNWQLTFS